jgi:ribonuclease-3
MPEENSRRSGIARALGHEFGDAKLLERALTHRSAGGANNERLEYLGDAILDFLVAEALYFRFPQAPEGALTRLRATLVRRETLAAVARERGIGEFVLLGPGEKKSGGWRRDSILSNTLEALIGAVYLDAGMDRARDVVMGLFGGLMSGLSPTEPGKDPKTSLQEFLQARHRPLPVYTVIAEEGEAHDRLFRVQCLIGDSGRAVVAEGRSKRSAEQAAAQLALMELMEGEPG